MSKEPLAPKYQIKGENVQKWVLCFHILLHLPDYWDNFFICPLLYAFSKKPTLQNRVMFSGTYCTGVGTNGSVYRIQTFAIFFSWVISILIKCWLIKRKYFEKVWFTTIWKVALYIESCHNCCFIFQLESPI